MLELPGTAPHGSMQAMPATAEAAGTYRGWHTYHRLGCAIKHGLLALTLSISQIAYAASGQIAEDLREFNRGPSTALPDSAVTDKAPPFNSNQTLAQASSDSALPARQRYELALETIDSALAAWEIKRSVIPGFDQSLELILQSRRKALDAFFDADLSEAVRLVLQALEEIDYVMRQEEDYFDLNMDIALAAYEAEDYRRAKQAIELAVTLRSDSEEAEFWRTRIDQLPKLITARNAAVTARNAGRLRDEIKALNEALSLKSNDDELQARLTQATRQLRDRDFNRAISQGHKALDDQDPAKAEKALASAQRIKPAHAEVQRLKQKIADVSRNMQIASLMTLAARSIEQDDWYSALVNYNEVLKIQPELNDAIKGQQTASWIVSTQRSLNDFLARPGRLSSSNIAEAARKEIANARPALELSPHLSAAVAALEVELEKWQAKVPVRVISDGETHIDVRGVGVIGKVADKTVMLRPGTYQFEGKRKGYRNKLIEVLVINDENAVNEVRIICDERT